MQKSWKKSGRFLSDDFCCLCNWARDPSSNSKIRKDNTPGRENEAHSHRTSHSTWEEDQRPPNLGSRTSGKHWKVRECRLMMSCQMWPHLWFLPKVPLWTKFHWAVLGHSKILLPKHPKNFWYQWDGAKCHCLPWGNPTTADFSVCRTILGSEIFL